MQNICFLSFLANKFLEMKLIQNKIIRTKILLLANHNRIPDLSVMKVIGYFNKYATFNANVNWS